MWHLSTFQDVLISGEVHSWEWFGVQIHHWPHKLPLHLYDKKFCYIVVEREGKYIFFLQQMDCGWLALTWLVIVAMVLGLMSLQWTWWIWCVLGVIMQQIKSVPKNWEDEKTFRASLPYKLVYQSPWMSKHTNLKQLIFQTKVVILTYSESIGVFAIYQVRHCHCTFQNCHFYMLAPILALAQWWNWDHFSPHVGPGTCTSPYWSCAVKGCA
jgi:hypothetical protein